MMKKRSVSFFRALAITGLAVGTAYAGGTSTWTGKGDGQRWTDAANWDTLPTFDGTTQVVFDKNSIPSDGATLSLDGDKAVKSLRFNHDKGAITLGPKGDTLKVESGHIQSNAHSTINADLVLGADGTTGTQAYHHSLVINGDLGETGGSRSLTLNTDGGRTTLINGDLNLTGALNITGGRGNYLGGANHASRLTVGSTNKHIAYFGVGRVESLGRGPLAFHGNSGFRTAGHDLTILNPTSMGGTVHVAPVSAYEANFIADLPGARGRARWRFIKPIKLTADLTLRGGSHYTRSAGTEFAGGFTGDHHITFDLSRYMEITGAGPYTGGTRVAGGEVVATVEGALGTGDVTVASNDKHTAKLALESDGAIDPGATLTLGDANGAKWFLVLDYGGLQTVAGLTIDGKRIPPGTTYAASDYAGEAGKIMGLGELHVASQSGAARQR